MKISIAFHLRKIIGVKLLAWTSPTHLGAFTREQQEFFEWKHWERHRSRLWRAIVLCHHPIRVTWHGLWVVGYCQAQSKVWVLMIWFTLVCLLIWQSFELECVLWCCMLAFDYVTCNGVSVMSRGWKGGRESGGDWQSQREPPLEPTKASM